MPEFNRWSNTALLSIARCGEQFRRRHMERDARPAGVKAKRGISVHKVASEIHKLQMQLKGTWDGPEESTMVETPGTLRSVEEAKDIAASAFALELRGGVSFSKEERDIGLKAVIAHEKDTTVDLAGLYAGEVAPPINPIAVERKIEVKPKDTDISIVGILDLIENTPDGEVVRDLKTGEKRPLANAADFSGQLTIQNMIRKAETGKIPVASRLVHLTRTPKLGDMDVIVQTTTRDEADLRRLAMRINMAVEAVKKGVFIPADPGAPGSPCGYCDYRDDCKYVKPRV